VSLLLGCPWLFLDGGLSGLACLVDGFSIRPAKVTDTAYVLGLPATVPDTATITLSHELLSQRLPFPLPLLAKRFVIAAVIFSTASCASGGDDGKDGLSVNQGGRI
jgi:hypothetical protein